MSEHIWRACTLRQGLHCMLVTYISTSVSSILSALSIGHYLKNDKLPGVSILGKSPQSVSEEDERTRFDSSYMREMTGKMIITHEQLTLIEKIGEGDRNMCMQTLGQPIGVGTKLMTGNYFHIKKACIM